MTRFFSLIFFFPLLLSAQNYGTLHFEDNFDDNRNVWSLGDQEGYSTKLEKGHFVMNNTDKDKSRYFYIPVEGIDFTKEDFVIEARMRQKDGEENQGYGLRYCIYKDLSNFRNFFVASNGHYKVSHFYSKEDNKIIDWTKDQNIVKPKGSYNVLRIERKANVIRYYVNDQFVGYNSNNRYFAERMGFYLSGLSTVEVDYIKIWKSPLSINFVDNPLENVKTENLGSAVNTELIEKAPVISPDGKTMYFVREMKDSQGKEDDSDVFYSTLGPNGEWIKAVSIGAPINNPGKNSVIMVMPDNNTLLLMNRYKRDGSSAGGGVSVSHRTAEGWEMPQNLTIKEYKNKSPYAGYSLSPSGKVMIMAAERDQTVGERDLYVSFRENDTTWSVPVGIGKVINTFGQEDSPFIAADDKTLYFSSNGHPGLGGSDVFVTRRLDDTWLNWSEPRNLGSGINSHRDEYGFKIAADGIYAYLYKDPGQDGDGFGKSDLYRVALSESARPEPIVFIEGRVLDSETKQPLAAQIIYEDLNSKKELGIANSEPKNGEFKIALPYGKVYGFLANKENYYAVSENIDLSKVEQFKTIKKDLYLTPIRKGVNIRMNNIFFEHDKSDLKSTSFVELDRLVALMNANKDWKIEIGGHTDDVGADSYNKTLSQKRANAVKDYLISKGIAVGRLTAVGYGEEKPIAGNNTEEGKAQNRRVEFRIL